MFRERTHEDRIRLTEQENRASIIQSEMRELMDERSDSERIRRFRCKARSGRSKLSNLLDQAEALAIATRRHYLISKKPKCSERNVRGTTRTGIIEDGAQFDGLGPVLRDSNMLEHRIFRIIAR